MLAELEVVEKDLVLKELQGLEERDGILKPDAVVEFAQDENTALHSHFTWDNTEAAHQHRLWQARQLIRVTVTTIKGENSEVQTNAFVNVVSGETRGYRSIAVVLSDEDLKKQMLTTALKELQTFKKKYAELKELASIFDAIDKWQA